MSERREARRKVTKFERMEIIHKALFIYDQRTGHVLLYPTSNTFSSNENSVLMNERFYYTPVHDFTLPEALSKIPGT
jgi:hypothetical protein